MSKNNKLLAVAGAVFVILVIVVVSLWNQNNILKIEKEDSPLTEEEKAQEIKDLQVQLDKLLEIKKTLEE